MYQVTIIRAERHFEPGRWVTYDWQFRREALARKDLDWSQKISHLYIETFTGRAKNLPLCSTCGADDHPGSRCPGITMSRDHDVPGSRCPGIKMSRDHNVPGSRCSRSMDRQRYGWVPAPSVRSPTGGFRPVIPTHPETTATNTMKAGAKFHGAAIPTHAGVVELGTH